LSPTSSKVHNRPSFFVSILEEMLLSTDFDLGCFCHENNRKAMHPSVAFVCDSIAPAETFHTVVRFSALLCFRKSRLSSVLPLAGHLFFSALSLPLSISWHIQLFIDPYPCSLRCSGCRAINSGLQWRSLSLEFNHFTVCVY